MKGILLKVKNEEGSIISQENQKSTIDYENMDKGRMFIDWQMWQFIIGK